METNAIVWSLLKSEYRNTKAAHPQCCDDWAWLHAIKNVESRPIAVCARCQGKIRKAAA